MDKREQIARMAQTKEDEVLLARVYERITMAAQRNVPATSSVTSMMKEMTVDDTYTCTLTLTEPFGAIESCIAASYLSIVNKAADEADPDGYGRAPIGTGPYKFVRWELDTLLSKTLQAMAETEDTVLAEVAAL